jgi:hypothetical protein
MSFCESGLLLEAKEQALTLRNAAPELHKRSSLAHLQPAQPFSHVLHSASHSGRVTHASRD